VAFDHVSIGVASDEDLWGLKSRFEAAEKWVSEVIDHGFIHSLYAFDPNNIPIEFSAPVAEVDIRQHPKMMDKHPSDTAREGPDPVAGRWPQPVGSIPAADKVIYPGEGKVFEDD
jgi:hypothetical protein